MASTPLASLLLLGDLAVVAAASNGATARYILWLPAAVVALCAALIWAGRRAWSQTRIGGAVLAGIGLVLALLIAPSLAMERVTVVDDGVSVRSGIFGRTAALYVDLRNVRALRVESELSGGRFPRRIEVLVFAMKDGASVRFPLNNDVKIAGAREIVATARRRGIAIPKG